RAVGRCCGEQPVDLRAGANDGDVELPAIGTGACAGCLESAYREWADTGGIEPGNPAGTDVIRQRSALRQRHAVEAHGKVSRTGGSDRGSGIVDDEALRDRKGDAQPRMQEGMAAYIAFLGRVAEQHAVDAGEERV